MRLKIYRQVRQGRQEPGAELFLAFFALLAVHLEGRVEIGARLD